jgi:ABC-type oligopeptide transport system substrate-binding subunit
VVIGWDESGQPVYKDNPVTLFDSFGSAIRSVDSITCGDTTSSGLQGNFYEGLYTYHYLKRPVGAQTVVPQLAAELPRISEDGLTYTIPLKKGVLYQRNPCFGPMENGRYPTREVKAKDFVLAFKRCADFYVDTKLSWAFLAKRVEGLDEYRELTKTEYSKDQWERYDVDVSGVRALDDYTLQIKLKRRFPQFLLVLAMHVYAPVPRERIDYWLVGKEPLLTEFRKPESVVGTGPYLLHTWQTKKKIILVRNPDFRYEEYPTEGEEPHGDYPGDKARGLLADAGKQVPFIDMVVRDYMGENYSEWMTFLAKRKDANAIPRQTFEFVVTPDRELTDRWKKRNIYMRKAWSPAIYWIAFNMDDSVVGKSKSLRQALCLAFDVKSYIKVLHNGRGKPAVNIVPSTFVGHEAAGEGPYYTPHTDENRDDLLARAKAKLAEAKKELAAAGALVNGEIPKLKLDATQGPNASTQSDFIRQQFAKLDLEVDIVLNDWPTLQTKVHNKDVQMYTMGWHADYPDAENFLQLFYGPNIDKGTNNTNYSDEQFDQWYEKARVMEASPQRLELYVKMIRKISQDVPVLLLSEPLGFALFYDWVENVKAHPIGYGYTKYRDIDVDLRRRLGGRTE